MSGSRTPFWHWVVQYFFEGNVEVLGQNVRDFINSKKNNSEKMIYEKMRICLNDQFGKFFFKFAHLQIRQNFVGLFIKKPVKYICTPLNQKIQCVFANTCHP